MVNKSRTRAKAGHRCPTCGSQRMRTVVGDFRTRIQGEEVIVPQLERDECPDCAEILFGPAAMRKMESYRKVEANTGPQ